MTETESKWTERVQEWKSSGKSAKEFAAGREFKASTLVYWASCLRRSRGARPTSPPRRLRMARVIPAARPAADDAIVVTVGAARVGVRARFDSVLLRGGKRVSVHGVSA
jgi:hypothetical protein